MSRARIRWLACGLAVLAELTLCASALAADSHKQVLTLYSVRRDAELATIGENVLPGALDIGLNRNLDYYSEFIDVARFPDPEYRAGFGDFLRLKYQGIRFDLVIAIGDDTIAFIDGHRSDLFPATPMVFLANARAAAGNATGIISERNFSGTFSLIEKLQPDVRNVFVVSGATAADQAFERLVRMQARSFNTRLAVTYLSGLPTPDLERRLATLPRRSAVYYALVTEDGAGRRFHPLEYIDLITAAANAPTYSWAESTLDHGVVGGSLYNQRGAMERIGQLALRVLGGERAEGIPVSSPDLYANQVDWRQLQRWRIREARVPAGTIVRFREPAIWDRYSSYILGAAGILVVQTLLIAGLLVQRARRRRAEQELRDNQERLRTSYQQIRDLGGRLLGAQEAERSRIARELHDDISQQMALLTMDLESWRDADRDQANRLAEEALVRARDVVKGVRELSHRLHPARLRLIGLVPALQALCAELSSPPIQIGFTHDNVPSTLPSDLMLCLFRIVQEGVHNAIKYSQASEISVYLAEDANGLTLSIIDNGIGFDVATAWGKGLGLVSISERVDAVGGLLGIHSEPHRGTRLIVTVPRPVLDSMAASSTGPSETVAASDVGLTVEHGV